MGIQKHNHLFVVFMIAFAVSVMCGDVYSSSTDENPPLKPPDGHALLEPPFYQRSMTFSHTGHGVDDLLPIRYTQGSFMRFGGRVHYPNHFYSDVRRMINTGDPLSDFDEGTLLTLGYQRYVSSAGFSFSAAHRWLHASGRDPNEGFFAGDRSHTIVQLGVPSDHFLLQLLAASDLPTYQPDNHDSSLYVGIKFDTKIPLYPKLNTGIHLGSSFVRSIFWYNQNPTELGRLYVGIGTDLGFVPVSMYVWGESMRDFHSSYRSHQIGIQVGFEIPNTWFTIPIH